jgi:hypothetical protein
MPEQYKPSHLATSIVGRGPDVRERRCDFRTVIPLLDLVNAIATAWRGSRVLSLMQQPAVVAASGVFCRLQVTDFDGPLRFFLSHFILLSI